MALIETWLSQRDRGVYLFSHSVGAAFRPDNEAKGRPCLCAKKEKKNTAAQGMSEWEKLNFHPRHCFCILTCLIGPPQQNWPLFWQAVIPLSSHWGLCVSIIRWPESFLALATANCQSTWSFFQNNSFNQCNRPDKLGKWGGGGGWGGGEWGNMGTSKQEQHWYQTVATWPIPDSPKVPTQSENHIPDRIFWSGV